MNPTSERGAVRHKARLADVAAAAGVSVGTVDRVVNARGSVRPETERRVLAAARALGLDRALDLRPTRALRLGVLMLNRSVDPFYDQLIAGFQECVRHYGYLNVSVFFYFFELEDHAGVLEKIELIHSTCDGIVIDTFVDPAISQRLSQLAWNYPVLTIVSDLPECNRMFFAGADGRAGGRVAAELMGRFLAGRGGAILIITGLHSFVVQEEHEIGFRNVIAERFPALRIAETYESFERADVYDSIVASFRGHPDIVGVFNISTGNDSIARALKDLGQLGKVIFMITGLTPPNRRLLQNGIVDAIIDQDEQHLAWLAVEEFLAYYGRLPGRERRSIPRFEIYLSEDCRGNEAPSRENLRRRPPQDRSVLRSTASLASAPEKMAKAQRG